MTYLSQMCEWMEGREGRAGRREGHRDGRGSLRQGWDLLWSPVPPGPSPGEREVKERCPWRGADAVWGTPRVGAEDTKTPGEGRDRGKQDGDVSCRRVREGPVSKAEENSIELWALVEESEEAGIWGAKVSRGAGGGRRWPQHWWEEGWCGGFSPGPR